METFFASPERADREELLRQNALFKNNESLINIVNSVSQMLVVLNKERQIIFANKKFCDLVSISENNYLGKRVGEALNCIHSSQLNGGCGTTRFCSKCGAVNAMLEAELGETSEKECRITAINSESLDLKVTATPYTLQNEVFTVFAISDLSHEKRRQILERVFFHDVLNSAGGISGLSSVLTGIKDPDEVSEVAKLIHRSSEQLINEINAHRQLTAAENGDMVVNITDIESTSLLKQLAELYSKHEITREKYIIIDSNAESLVCETDPTLLKRVLGNMLKNALEASYPGSTITLSSTKKNGAAKFWVHNENYIEPDAQLQLFKRSFTTKGVGRGLGTYSMKLFGEKYLKGEVGFVSEKNEGTTFFIKLPTG